MTMADWAEGLAFRLLGVALPRRWAHTCGVAEQARSLVPVLADDADLLEAAGWLHDIGYSPALTQSGFHPLDGARYLRDVERADEVLCRLVAHHSCAAVEASERGLLAALNREFAAPRIDLAQALIFCDMTTDPDGGPTTVRNRLTDVLTRYEDGHVVNRAIRRSAPLLMDAAEAVSRRVAHHASHHRPPQMDSVSPRANLVT